MTGYDSFMGGAPGGGMGGFGSLFGSSDWGDVPDPEFGWGDALDQDGDPATKGKDWRKVFGAMQQGLAGQQGGQPMAAPSAGAPSPLGPLQGIPPEYIIPLLNMYIG